MRAVLVPVLMAAALPSQALAIATSISSTFSGATNVGTLGTELISNDGRTVFREGEDRGYASIETNALLDTDGASSFLFKHDLVATGSATATARTVLTISITNDSGAAGSFRFDSTIIPGHLAIRMPRPDEPVGSSYGFIDFNVRLDGAGLYNLTQGLDTLTPSEFDPQFLALNDLRRYDEPENDLIVFDWWYTNINLELGLFAAGETKTLVYDLYTLAATVPFRFGPDLTPTCPHVQLSFGDPRARGTTTSSVDEAMEDHRGTPNNVCDRENQPTNLDIDPALFSFSIVRSGSPLPPQPIAPPPIDYTAIAAVPAPPAFALLGLAALTLGLSRRRS